MARGAQEGPCGWEGLRAKHLPPLSFEISSELKEITPGTGHREMSVAEGGVPGIGSCPWHREMSMAQGDVCGTGSLTPWAPRQWLITLSGHHPSPARSPPDASSLSIMSIKPGWGLGPGGASTWLPRVPQASCGACDMGIMTPGLCSLLCCNAPSDRESVQRRAVPFMRANMLLDLTDTANFSREKPILLTMPVHSKFIRDMIQNLFLSCLSALIYFFLLCLCPWFLWAPTPAPAGCTGMPRLNSHRKHSLSP